MYKEYLFFYSFWILAAPKVLNIWLWHSVEPTVVEPEQLMFILCHGTTENLLVMCTIYSAVQCVIYFWFCAVQCCVCLILCSTVQCYMFLLLILPSTLWLFNISLCMFLDPLLIADWSYVREVLAVTRLLSMFCFQAFILLCNAF